MELRAYETILSRRWLAFVLIPLAALAVILVVEQSRQTQYTAGARLSVSRLSGEATTAEYEFDDYYDLLASDFILDDTVEVVRGNVFAAAVAARMNEQGIAIDPATVEGALAASREHRVLTISSTTSDHGLAIVIANMAAAELQEDFADYLGVEGEPLPVTIRPVHVPFEADSDDFRIQLTYLIALIVAAGFGLIVALGLEYFDPRLSSMDSARDALGLDVLGVVQETQQ
jgi:capsular polysaccharide biosynthesis protein